VNNGIIQVQGLCKRFQEVLAVDHLDFSVHKGEIFGFLGPNGAGKTTTVRILTGIIKPDEGKAFIMGHKAGTIEAKQITGVVPETANAYADLSGWKNLLLMAELYGVPARKAREGAAILLQTLGIFDRRNDPVKMYSKGMKQRLILCLALISEPPILFLDEPTSGLDVQSARLIKTLIQDLKLQGKTIFYTTHDMNEANQLCDRVAIINHGKIVAIDAPEKIRVATSSLNSIEVSFEDILGAEDLAGLPGVNAVEKLGDKYRLFTACPGELVVSLVNYACARGFKIISLNTLAPSLEDAFVALTKG
jgi:ABC-2 type transport system ATP-binding protein